MGKPIKLSDDLVQDATIHAKAQHRTPPRQIERWARIGKIAEENPEMTFQFVQDILISIEEEKAGEVSEYQFG